MVTGIGFLLLLHSVFDNGHSRNLLFFFGTNNIGYLAGDVDGRMNSFLRFSSRYSYRALSSVFDKAYIRP